MFKNFFYFNRNQPSNVLYFKEWLPNVYLPNVKTLRRNNVNIAESQYRQELEEAITTYGTNNSKNKRKLVDILSQFNATSK
ncbi:10086_t:CDS:1, partial [Gigaspora margarita]